MTTHLQEALERLYGLERRKDKLGLEGTQSLLEALGNPHQRFRSVHVAGTNGKGSVCALIERVLREAGYRTGLFTSPHLVDFRERIRVNGRWADGARLEQRLAHIQSLPEGQERTFFEVCTALAFDDFVHGGVEIAVVEVGLGGRLDCTNVISPEVSVITSIGLDHTEILGDTIEKIAAEKAGIIKPGVPVVVGRLKKGALEVVARLAAERQAPLTSCANVAIVEFGEGRQRGHARGAPWGELELEIAMSGDFQVGNAAVALEALAALTRTGFEVPPEAVRDGFRATRWPGRLDRCPSQPRLWWDGAHNTQGVEALVRAWRRTAMPAPRGMVLAMSRDKDVAAIVRSLSPIARDALLVATRSRSERAVEPERVAAAAAAAGIRATVAPDIVTACRAALEAAGDAPVLLTGSLFAVGEAMEAFGGAPGEWL